MNTNTPAPTPEQIDALELELRMMGVQVPARDTAFFHAAVRKWLASMPASECRWTQMDQGGHAYNTCEPEHPYHVEPGCDPWPHCHHCGRSVVLVPWEQWGDNAES